MLGPDDTARWYFACGYCTAKWFARRQRMPCPRCETDYAATEQLVPPWLSGKSPVDASEKRSEFINAERKNP